MRFIDILREKQQNDVIQDLDLHQIFADKSDKAIQSAISRCLHAGELIRLKRGLYIFGEKHRQHAVTKFMLAAQLYSPSYVSFESALSLHQLIPEAVYVTTSACFLNKIKHYSNAFGEFSFQYIPVRPFFLEVEYLKNQHNNALIAKPLRALYDLFYQRKMMYQTLDELEDDLRLDLEELRMHLTAYQACELHQLAAAYKSQAVKTANQLLVKKLL